jgi:hypothetical protein
MIYTVLKTLCFFVGPVLPMFLYSAQWDIIHDIYILDGSRSVPNIDIPMVPNSYNGQSNLEYLRHQGHHWEESVSCNGRQISIMQDHCLFDVSVIPK